MELMDNGVILTNFLGPSYQSDLISYSNELSQNLYYEKNEGGTGSYTDGILRCIEGTKELVNFGSTGIGCRGLYWASTGPAPDRQPQLYAAFENKIYRVDSEFNKHLIGNVGSNSTTIKFSESGGINSHLLVVDGYNLFAMPLSASNDNLSLIQVTLPNQAGTELTPILPTDIAFLGGRVVINSVNSDQCYYTDLYAINGTTSGYTSAFNDANFFTAENTSDIVTGLISLNGNMWVFGPRSYQVYQYQDNQYIPFITVSTAGNQIGCKATKSIVAIGESVFWLGSSNSGENTIFMSNGIGSINRISNNAIEREISNMTESSDAFGQTWNRNGHVFYAITFPSADKTFVYDVSTGKWHNRSTRDASLNINHMWEHQYATLAYGKIVFGTYNNHSLVYLDDNTATEWDGRPIVKLRISPVIISQFSNVMFNEFELECNNGSTTTLNGQGSDPQVMLQVSNDGGYTWSNEIWRQMGKAGQYSFRTKWNGLGIGRLFVIKISVSDPVKFIITAAKVRMTPCNSF
jgi:hypothetical protein